MITFDDIVMIEKSNKVYSYRWIRKAMGGHWIKFDGEWHHVKIVKLNNGEYGTFYLTAGGLINANHPRIEERE